MCSFKPWSRRNFASNEQNFEQTVLRDPRSSSYVYELFMVLNKVWKYEIFLSWVLSTMKNFHRILKKVSHLYLNCNNNKGQSRSWWFLGRLMMVIAGKFNFRDFWSDWIEFDGRAHFEKVRLKPFKRVLSNVNPDFIKDEHESQFFQISIMPKIETWSEPTNEDKCWYRVYFYLRVKKRKNIGK